MSVARVESKHRPQTVLRSKVVVVGDPCVGKTALVQLFHSGGMTYSKNYIMTCGVDVCVKSITLPDLPVRVELYLHDTGGQSIFHSLSEAAAAWDGVNSVMLVYDVSSRDSFANCAKWLRDVGAVHPAKLQGVLVANKTDLIEAGRQQVTPEEGRAFAARSGLHFFETSAAIAKDVESPFNFLADLHHKQYTAYLQEIKTRVVG